MRPVEPPHQRAIASLERSHGYRGQRSRPASKHPLSTLADNKVHVLRLMRRLREAARRLPLIDFGVMCTAPAPFDLAHYAARLVRVREGDGESAQTVLAPERMRTMVATAESVQDA